MSRTYVPCEVDALANQKIDSPAGILAKITSNRRAREVATGEDYVTGAEVDWLLAQAGDFPTYDVLEARRWALEAKLDADVWPGAGAG